VTTPNDCYARWLLDDTDRAGFLQHGRIEDLAQYYKDITPIVNNAKVLARQKKVAARKQAVMKTGTIQTR
jgi:hypothetical protein